MMSVQMAALDTSSGAFVTSDYYEPVTDADELERLRAQVAQLEYKLAAISGDSPKRKIQTTAIKEGVGPRKLKKQIFENVF